jgi:hypothetical protein
MLAFKISINGKVTFVIGQEDMAVLHATVTAVKHGALGAETDIDLAPGGLSRELDDGYGQHFHWGRHDLRVGDSVTVEIVDTTDVDAPLKRYRSDIKKQENPFTEEELKRARHARYLRLKSEFEPTDGIK